MNLGRIAIVAQGDYDETRKYKKLDTVNFKDSIYIALMALDEGESPTIAPTKWMLGASKGKDFEAIYNDTPETLAGDVIKRVDKATGEDVNYREVTTLHDGSVIDDTKVDGIIYLKKDNKYYVDIDFVLNKTIKLSRYLPNDGNFHSISSVFPNVTNLEVQEFESTATTANSAGWFLISKLLSWVPKGAKIDIDMDVKIDQTIILKRGFISFISSGVKADKINNWSPYLGKRCYIEQIADKDTFKVVDGDGTIHLNGYIENVFFEDLDVIGNYKGDGISFHLTPNGVGTAIFFSFKNMSFNQHKNGFKHYTGHINDFFFENTSFSMNFDIGFELNSDNQNQTNYFVLNNSRFDSNGFDYDVNNSVIDYVQDLENPNWNKGGAKLNGTAIYLKGVSAQVNHGFGIWLNDYVYGGNFDGYSEANPLGDFIADQTKEKYKNVSSTLYSSGQHYIFKDDDVRALFLTSYSYFANKDLALKQFSQNGFLNPHNFELDGGSDASISKTINADGIAEYNHINGGYLYPKLKTEFQPFKPKDIYVFSFDCYLTEFQGQDFGLHPGLLSNSISIQGVGGKLNQWNRVSHVFVAGNELPEGYNLLPFIRNPFGSTAGIKVRLPILQKLEIPHTTKFEFDSFRVMPKKDDCIATDTIGVVAYLNDLIAKLKTSNFMANE